MLTRPAAAPSVVAEDVDGDLCLYRPETDEVVILNSSAARVWQLCDGEHTVGELLAQLAEDYQRPVAELHADVEGVLVDLTGRGYLIESTIPQPPPGVAQ